MTKFVSWLGDRSLRRANRDRDRLDWKSAHQNYAIYLERHPDRGDIWLQHGHALKEAGEHLRAVEAYKQAVTLLAEPVEARRSLAFLLRDMGERSQATDAFLAMAQDPQARVEAVNLGAADRLRDVLLDDVTESSTLIWFEVGDFIRFHIDHARPTGIQRVIGESIPRLLERNPEAALLMIGVGGVTQSVDRSRFAKLIALSKGSDDDATRALARELFEYSPIEKVGPGSLVLTLGAFWSDPFFLDGLEYLKASGSRIWAMVHDLIPISHPDLAEPGAKKRLGPAFDRLTKISDKLISVSPNTAQAVQDTGYPASQCEVVRLSHSSLGAKPSEQVGPADQSLVEPASYVLTVGTIEARKNHALLVDLWREYANEGRSPPTLVLAGRAGWGVDDLLEELGDATLADGTVRWVGAVSDDNLRLLYSGCRLTIFPSYVEGWGLPVGESLAFGKLCIASEAVAAVSNATLTFDPHSLTNLRRVLDPLLFDDPKLRAAEKTAFDRFESRSWDDVANELHQLIVAST